MPHASQSTTTERALADPVAGGLAYFAGVPAIYFLIREPYNRRPFVRFHCWQSIYYLITSIVIGVLLGVITEIVPQLKFLEFDHFPLVSLVLVVVWVVAMLEAFNGKRFKLPALGEMAEKRAHR
ncbi:MAG TPA: hypothetical protein VMV57_00145 [Terracidiphilus sp.]|nr:hypothetical protein [Terracidiphilus sp.]